MVAPASLSAVPTRPQSEQKVHYQDQLPILKYAKRDSLASPLHQSTGSSSKHRVTYNTTITRPKVGFSLASRHYLPEPETPSPDAYQPPIQLGNGAPQWSIAGKLHSMTDLVPGPSEYDPQLLRVKYADQPAYSMRIKLGPPLFSSKEVGPGYNKYHPLLPRSNITTSLKGRPTESKVLKTPGPANYIIATTIPSGPQINMAGREEEDSDDETPHHPTPGPASYTPCVTITSSQSPKYSLGMKHATVKNTALSPGPGIYISTQSTIQANTAPKVSLKGRIAIKAVSTPGPGDYNTSSTTTVEDLIYIAMTRKLAIKATQKAAQSNAVQNANAPKSESNDHIIKNRKSIGTPGPADYTVNHIGYISPKYTLSSRSFPGKDATSTLSPGPSSYSPKTPTTGRTVSMKSRPSDAVLVFPTLRILND